ncbi:Uncharacterised protein [Moraxella ovis]|uniref:Uncharacterized protein n=1 Tax=Moraxella ovis TaxID=29433 RepID=A0A378PK71_9GAMM|nr:Uncharacterised protein [Moraxella ovis]
MSIDLLSGSCFKVTTKQHFATKNCEKIYELIKINLL